jgi:ComF family protein
MHGLLWLGLEVLASALAPPRCASCDIGVGLLAVFCPACAAQAEATRPAGPNAIAAYVYEGAIARVIGRLKYERRPDLARPLGDLLWRAVAPHADELRGAIVVPVPLHPARLAERGFNQSALLARRLARRLDAPCAMRALARDRDTAHQAKLDRSARARNAEGAFVVRDARAVRGRAVLLVDDVRTTGATLDACTRALATAGAARVAWTVVAQAGGVRAASTPAAKGHGGHRPEQGRPPPPEGVLSAAEVSSTASS